MSSAVYFTAPDGTRYRLLDVVFRDGKHIIADPAASWATSRLFRPKTGWVRQHRFAPGENRLPTEAQLERQFVTAEFLAPEAEDVTSRIPR